MSESVFKDNTLPLFANATKESTARRSGTVHGSVKHGLVHTSAMPATIHHVITAAKPHPHKDRADNGEYYMVGYISAPTQWLPFVDNVFRNEFDITFFGPVGVSQKLPPTMLDMEDVIGERFYLGVDWLWLARGDAPPEQRLQPAPDYVKGKMLLMINALRSRAEYELGRTE